MQVKAIRPRGYCKGVVRAIEMAKQARGEKQPVVILGMIVHNQYIVDALKQMGIETIDHPGKTRLELLDEIQEGTVIITAHGAGDQVFEKARAKGLNVIDASCLDVIKTHELIKEKLSKGYEILYIGKKGHPEAEGAVSIDAERIHLIGSKEDLKTLDPGADYVITNQTTMSLYDVQDLCEYAKEILPSVTIEKETCTATKVRQEAIKNMDADIDVVFIVGDPDQTIYTWRNAHVKLFLDFDKKYPDAQTIVLSINYRSTPEILKAASTLIEKNKLRYPKCLSATK